MAATIGALNVDLSIGTARFKKGLDEAQRGLAGMQKRMAGAGAAMQSLGTKLSVGVTAPLAAFGVSAFNAASDAAELQSAFDQTFGRSAAAMTKWAEETGNALGRSTQELQKAANTFGVFFNTAVPADKAAAMSQTFAKLAEDLGSFYNVDTETAIEKLRSGLSGESEPLRDFGVFLTEASVKAKALELGLTGVGNELTEQEKIVARYQLILEATKNAQGDVERTSSGTANQMRATAAAFEELQVTVGTKLLPVLTPLIAKLGEALNWFQGLPEPVRDTALAVGGVSAVVGPLVIALGSFTNAAGILLPAVVKVGGFLGSTLIPILAGVGRALVGLAIAGGPITVLVAALGAAYLAWQNWDKIAPVIRELVATAKAWLVDKLGPIFDFVKRGITAVHDAFNWLTDKVTRHSYVPEMVDGIAASYARLDGVMVKPALAAISTVHDGFASLRDMPAISLPTIAPAGLTVDKAPDVTGGGDEAPATTVDRLRDALRQVGDVGSGAFGRVVDGLGQVIDKVTQAREETQGLGGDMGGLTDAFSGLFGKKAGRVIGGLFQIGTAAAKAFGGARAMGGPVSAGKAYLVGERGPEIFAPTGGGTIVPNHAIGGRAAPISFDLRGAVMTTDLLRQMQAIAAGTSGAAVTEAARTGAIRQRQSLG